MPRVITPGFLDAMFQGFNVKFNDAFKGTPITWSRVGMEVPSTGESENYGWLGQFPRFREWIGDRVSTSLNAYGHVIKNKKWESTISIPREQIADDKYGMFSPMFAEMGRSAAVFPDEQIYGLMKLGFTTNCYDGQYFFDVDHPVLDASGVAQSVSNYQSGSGNPWFLLDATRAIKPMIWQVREQVEMVSKVDPNSSDQVFMRDEYSYGARLRANAGFGLWQLAAGSKATLNSANFRLLRQGMLNLKGDYGRPLGLMPSLLVCGSSNEAAARDLLWAEKLANGASNTDFKLVDLLIVPWLD